MPALYWIKNLFYTKDVTLQRKNDSNIIPLKQLFVLNSNHNKNHDKYHVKIYYMILFIFLFIFIV